MESAWSIFLDQNTLNLAHTSLPVRLEQWQVSLDYRVNQQECSEPLPFSESRVSNNPQTVQLCSQAGGISVQWRISLQQELRIDGVLKNTSPEPVSLERLCIQMPVFILGERRGHHSFFKNGYQSWSLTRSFMENEREANSYLGFLTTMLGNPRNLASQKTGHFTSDMFTVVGNLDECVYLLAGQAGGFHQFVYLRSCFPTEKRLPANLTIIYDFGGKMLLPGEQLALDSLVILAGKNACRLQEEYFQRFDRASEQTHAFASGWCSWYDYFNRVTEKECLRNLDVAQAQPVTWRYFVLDDGYEQAIGDWLSSNGRFPRGLKPLADQVQAAGMLPGLWLSPFIAHQNSHLFREHPEWTLKNGQGRPVSAGWNPLWMGRFYGLDVTHPGFQECLQNWIKTIVKDWGFRFLKLDYAFGACVYGNAHDPSLSPAERLELGYRLIHQAAGRDVFLLGCGSPLSASIGLVDAMRIGADVGPFWYSPLRTFLAHDPNADSARASIRNALNRCQMHHRLWINDPDCLLLRETATGLNPEERLALVNAVIIAGGMEFYSDRLDRYNPRLWQMAQKINSLINECGHGHSRALDFMERETPELVYNSRGYLAVFNFSDRTLRKRVSYQPHLVNVMPATVQLEDVWNGERFSIKEHDLDLGTMKPHSSRLLRICDKEAQE